MQIIKLINASDYGVPQNRTKSFVCKESERIQESISHFPEKQEKKGLTLENILDIPQGVKNQVDWPLSPQALEMITYIPEGGSWKDVPYEHLAPRFKKNKG